MYNIKPEKTITGTITCENCGTDIKWYCIIRSREYGVYSGSYPTKTTPASKLDKYNDNDNRYYVRCRNCDKKNYFQYIED